MNFHLKVPKWGWSRSAERLEGNRTFFNNNFRQFVSREGIDIARLSSTVVSSVGYVPVTQAEWKWRCKINTNWCNVARKFREPPDPSRRNSFSGHVPGHGGTRPLPPLCASNLVFPRHRNLDALSKKNQWKVAPKLAALRNTNFRQYSCIFCFKIAIFSQL